MAKVIGAFSLPKEKQFLNANRFDLGKLYPRIQSTADQPNTHSPGYTFIVRANKQTNHLVKYIDWLSMEGDTFKITSYSETQEEGVVEYQRLLTKLIARANEEES